VRQGGTIFNDQHTLATNGFRVIHKERGGSFNDNRLGIQFMQAVAHSNHCIRIRRIHLVNHKDIRCPDIGFTGMIGAFVTGSVRVSNHDGKIGNIEREVIIPAVPKDNIHFLFSLAQDGFVIDASVHNHTIVNVRFVFLALFNGALVLFQVSIRGKTLHFLLYQVPIGHGMADGCHLVAHIPQDQGNTAGGLAFARTGADRTDRNHRLGGFQLGGVLTHQAKIRTHCHDQRCLVHDNLMRHITVRKYHLVHLVFPNQVLQFAFRVNRNSFRVQRSSKLSRIAATFNVGNLCRRKCHNFVILVVTEENIEVVKVAPSGAHDESTNGHTDTPLCENDFFTSLVGL